MTELLGIFLDTKDDEMMKRGRESMILPYFCLNSEIQRGCFIFSISIIVTMTTMAILGRLLTLICFGSC